jgi:hypothetical protein
LSVEEEKTKGDLKKNGQKDEPLKVQLDTDQLKKVKKGDKLQLQEKPDTGDSDDDDDSRFFRVIKEMVVEWLTLQFINPLVFR